MSLKEVTQEQLDRIAFLINNRPRKRLGYRTMLNQLNIYHNFTKLTTQKSLPITLQDLNNSLEFSPVMRAIRLKQLEEIFKLESLEVNRAGKTIFSKSPIKLNAAEIHTLKTLEEVRTNLLAQKNPLAP